MSAYAAAGQHHHHAGPGETGVSRLGGRSLLIPALGLVVYFCRHEAGARVRLVSLGSCQYMFSSETRFHEKGNQINLEIRGSTLCPTARGYILLE